MLANYIDFEKRCQSHVTKNREQEDVFNQYLEKHLDARQINEKTYLFFNFGNRIVRISCKEMEQFLYELKWHTEGDLESMVLPHKEILDFLEYFGLINVTETDIRMKETSSQEGNASLYLLFGHILILKLKTKAEALRTHIQ